MRTAESVVLTPWPPGPDDAVDVDLEVVGIDVDLHLRRLGQHEHGGRRGVDATRALRDRHPLDAMGAALELEMAPGAASLDHERDLVEPAQVGQVGGEHLDRPAHAGGEGLVHLEEVAGEQVGFLAAFRAAYLDDDVLAVVGVGGDEEHLQLLLEARQFLLGGTELRSGQLPLVAAGVGQELAGGLEVGLEGAIAAEGGHQGVQVLVPLRRTAQAGGVAEHSRIGELSLHGFVLGLQALQAIQHGGRLRGANRRRHGHDLGRRTQEGGQPAGDRVVIAFGNGEDEPGSTSERQAGIRRERHQVQVDTGRAHHDDRAAGGVDADRRAGRRPRSDGERVAAPAPAVSGRRGSGRARGGGAAPARAPAG